MRLNLGAGSRPLPDHVNVDRVQLPGIDAVWNLDQFPWPWPDESAERITARDVFEHVAKPVGFMVECHRILIPGGLLWIRCPNVFLSPGDAFTDPTHRRYPTWNTFDYWIPGTVFHREHNRAYGGVGFELIDKRGDDGSMIVELRKIADPLDGVSDEELDRQW